MTARLRWKEDRDARPRSERRTLRALEWIFLVAGLLALDLFVWVNTSSVLYQAYEDWAFDQTLRGLTPNVGGFVNDEARWLWSGRSESAPKAEAPSAPSGVPNEQPAPSEATPALRSVIGRLEIPRLNLSVMVREGADERTLSRAVGHIPGTACRASWGTWDWPDIAIPFSERCGIFERMTRSNCRLRRARTATL